MSTIRRAFYATATLVSLFAVPTALRAQEHGGDGISTFGEDFPNGVTFWTRREPEGCWLCAPAIDVNGGIYQLEEGKDYQCKTVSFLALARMAAKKAGKTLKASKVEGGVVIQAMQITKPE